VTFNKLETDDLQVARSGGTTAGVTIATQCRPRRRAAQGSPRPHRRR
jgi:hypothetical protein